MLWNVSKIALKIRIHLGTNPKPRFPPELLLVFEVVMGDVRCCFAVIRIVFINLANAPQVRTACGVLWCALTMGRMRAFLLCLLCCSPPFLGALAEEEEMYDVIVIGVGPVGAFASHLLSSQGTKGSP